ncbi:hypothetical protein, partial [Pseudomonas nitroreducens]|uniref:hypothetical protein n=1 Tax=Pseudomonas nitroreducens TaxID=46680 RepID=UPI003D2D7739
LPTHVGMASKWRLSGVSVTIEGEPDMSLDYSTQQLRVTFAELAFRSESIALVLDQARQELPAGYAANIADVIALLKDDAEKLRMLAERTQGGHIQVLD